ncbi:methyltransferase domain-containing protein [Paracoccus sp. (in: a-proteobacteria)]|uniref:methyltransferase domain-containing protein n=1 Tax=Paracoccus sp. TaxID=267 RepID=UPI00396CB414
MTLAYRPTLSFLDRLLRQGLLPEGRPLHVLDVGSGYGDMLRSVAVWARRRNLAVKLTGIDLSPWSARAAREATSDGMQIDWRTGDIFAFRPDEPVDISVSALVAHHLSDDLLVRFLRWQEDATKVGWFINDLHRHPMPYHLFAQGSRLLRLHHFVQHDGPVSIARGFVRDDWHQALDAAGVDEADIRWWLPFRLCVSRVKRQ